jgi:hypothetical protein
MDKGDTVKENAPSKFTFYYHDEVSEGPARTIHQKIRCSHELVAPIYSEQGVQDLVHLTADLTHIPISTFKKKKGIDGRMYYEVKFAIEMTCHSAHTTYALIVDGIKYDTVTAEYV